MPRRAIPIHRQILLWLYVALFVFLAPLLIFYTAGYRYNIKKGQIERSSTLIVDSFPKGATVRIDERATQETTPITFQNMAPGWHRLDLEKEGYLPWSKNLELRAERVSFANRILIN
jgi:hypothetical protein